MNHLPAPVADVTRAVHRERLTGAEMMAQKAHQQAVAELDGALAQCDKEILAAEESILEEGLSAKLKQSRAYNLTRLKARKASLERSRRALDGTFAKERKALRASAVPASFMGRCF